MSFKKSKIKKTEKKVEKKVEKIEAKVEEIKKPVEKLSGSAALAQKINSIIRGK